MVARFRLDPVVLALAAACAALAAVVVHQVGSESHAKPGEAVGRHGTGTVDVAALQNWAMPPPPISPRRWRVRCSRRAGVRPRPHRLSRYPVRGRSEEHTSELQSLMRISYAVFCLKKKNKHR